MNLTGRQHLTDGVSDVLEGLIRTVAVKGYRITPGFDVLRRLPDLNAAGYKVLGTLGGHVQGVRRPLDDFGNALQGLASFFTTAGDRGHGGLESLHCVDPSEGRFNGVSNHVEHFRPRSHKTQGGDDFLNPKSPRSSCTF